MDMTREEKLQARIKQLEESLRDVRSHLSEIVIATTLTAFGRDHGRVHKSAAMTIIDTALYDLSQERGTEQYLPGKSPEAREALRREEDIAAAERDASER
jgi:hypothetical protein